MTEPSDFELLELATPYALDAVSEAERAEIDYTIGEQDRHSMLVWARELDDPDRLRGYARSANPLIRRSLASKDFESREALASLMQSEKV